VKKERIYWGKKSAFATAVEKICAITFILRKERM